MLPDELSRFRPMIIGLLAVCLSVSIGMFIGHRLATEDVTITQLYDHLTDMVSHANPWTPSSPPGKWHRVSDATERLTSKQHHQIEELKGLGYFSGIREATARRGTLIHNPSRVQPGFNLYVSGHGPEARLITNHGRTVHSWRFPWEKAFPESPVESPRSPRTRWRKVHLYPNGDLLAIYEGQGIIKIDRKSDLIWARKNQAHHDMWVAEDGIIYVLTRSAHIEPRYNQKQPILEDYISVLKPDGNTIRRISILDAFMESRYDQLIDTEAERGDVTHSNALEIITRNGREARYPFVEGHALITTRTPNVTALIDMGSNKVDWAMKGFFQSQHDSTLLPDDRLLLFDNQGYQGYSKVIEFDPFTQKIHWQYAGSPPESFYSECCGTAQRLSNGNTLITVTETGYALEVTPDREIVWEFHSPHRAGENKQLVAALYEVRRISPQFLSSWVDNQVRMQAHVRSASKSQSIHNSGL